MNERLRRLTIAFSLTTFLVFGSWAAYSYYQFHGLNSYIDAQLKEQAEVRMSCWDGDQPRISKDIACARLEGYDGQLSRIAPIAREHYSDARMGLWLAIGLPGLAFFLLFVGRWVMLGKANTSKLPK